MTNLLDQMAADAAAQTPVSTDKLGRLSELIDEMRLCEKEVADLEGKLKNAKEDLAKVSEVAIPDLFDELGVEQIELKDGAKVSVKRGYAATITDENRAQAFDWLRKNGHESIIKHVLAVSLKKGEKESHEKILGILAETGATYVDQEAVHAQTLKAFVNEQMTIPGNNFPQDLFKVFPLRFTKIK